MTPVRTKALLRAITQLGTTEHPPGTNSGPMVDKYLASCGLRPGSPWCMAFIHWCYQQYGVRLGGWASVGQFQNWAKTNGELVSRPFRGDIVCYDWDGDQWPDHVGLVVRVLALRWKNKVFHGWVKTIEGNTAVGNDSNGGTVMYRYRWIANAKFARIPDLLPYKP